MSRNMDECRDEVSQYSKLAERATELRRELNVIERDQRTLRAYIIGKMGKSKFGAIDGEDIFEVVGSGHRSVPLENVWTYAPKELWPLLIKEPTGKTLKFLKKVVK